MVNHNNTHIWGGNTDITGATCSTSLKRWFKHSFCWIRTSQYFSQQDELDIAQAVQRAELNHHAEIRVVIEAHLPSDQAYHVDCTTRSKQLFADLGVWDTQHNTGILLYINLCERRIELLADRGIHAQVTSVYWQQACEQMAEAFQHDAFKQGVIAVIEQLTTLLQRYMQQVLHNNNEISNSPILLD